MTAKVANKTAINFGNQIISLPAKVNKLTLITLVTNGHV